jgi:hypothetical protein
MIKVSVGDWEELPAWVKFKHEYFVLTDIHGKYRLMRALLKRRPKGVKPIILGDLTDRGFGNVEVLQYVHRHQKILLLKGNHDIALYYTLFPSDDVSSSTAKSLCLNHGGDITVEQLNKEPDISFVHDVYDRMKNFIIDGNLVFVHSGISPLNPQKSLSLTDYDALNLFNKNIDLHPVWCNIQEITEPIKLEKSPKYIIHGHVPVAMSEMYHDCHFNINTKGKELCAVHIKQGQYQVYHAKVSY